MKFIDINYKEFSQSIRGKLKYGDSLRKIAPTIGVSVSTLSRAINGKKVDLITALRICEWMNKSIYEFTIMKKQ